MMVAVIYPKNSEIEKIEYECRVYVREPLVNGGFEVRLDEVIPFSFFDNARFRANAIVHERENISHVTINEIVTVTNGGRMTTPIIGITAQ